jgi:hypothetical protein
MTRIEKMGWRREKRWDVVRCPEKQDDEDVV